MIAAANLNASGVYRYTAPGIRFDCHLLYDEWRLVLDSPASQLRCLSG
ncbi:MAG: hypothetical protein LC808_16220 [Actinobacteria bacterium]|nr:hypothetical protein [Actinomycetota bacterium]